MSKYTAYAPLVRASVAAMLGAVSLIGISSQVSGAEADDDVELEEVKVTGTRIQSPDVASANPIVSITGEEMRQLGYVNVADALTQLVPQNLSTYTDFAVGDNRGTTLDGADRGQYFIGNTIANLRGLDPAFGTRTLTLIDGRRSVSTSNQADVVDLNIIPSSLLQRMDVVTGGASATYGSGAMAGVVNLVLNNRLTGFNAEASYGANMTNGDGGSPQVSLSGGFPLFGGRGHMLLGGEWQKTQPIWNCAEARSWCNDSRAELTNSSSGLFGAQPSDVLTNQLPGFADSMARFQTQNVRYSQFSSNGVIYMTGQPDATSAYRFTPDGTGIEEYALGYRGGNGSGNVMNGDGPVATAGQSMRSRNERTSLFSNFEYNLTERTTLQLQARFAKTEGENRNNFTTSTNCVRFNTAGIAALPGANLAVGAVVPYSSANSTSGVYQPWANGAFRAWLGIGAAPGFSPPYWYQGPGTPLGAPWVQSVAPPTFAFNGNAVGNWVPFMGGPNQFWLLESITITNPAGFSDPGTPAVLPTLGRNSYAYLNNLTPEALEQVQRAFGNSNTSGPGPSYLVGGSPCSGSTAIRKVWDPQFQRHSSNESETMSLLTSAKGRFGQDWRWDVSAQYGSTESSSQQNNAATTIRQYFAMDAVIDDRAGSATFGQPICRVTRDGVPVLDTSGRPLSDQQALVDLAAGCQPLNIFGTTFTGAAAATQQAALDYAFVENRSAGKNSLASVQFSTNGTLWQGFGAGPLTGAFGLEVRQDKVNNPGSLVDNYYERFDITSGWSDKFGGTTRVTEGFSEFNLPVISGIEGMNLLSVNAAVRYSSIYNKGGAGTTRQSLTQETTNWKLQAVVEPVDWARFRISRSQDLRAAGYRDLFLNQPTPGGPDFLTGQNPWRERTIESTENQTERWGTVQVGNPLLKPESSNTLTLGLALTPGGWAQGMRVTADYYNIRVKDGIFVSYRNVNPINTCWEESGNRAQGTFPGTNLPDPSLAEINGNFDENNPACREITFAEQLDDNGNPIPGTRNLMDIVSYNQARPSNNLPFQRRGVDVSMSYNFPLNRMIESLPGSMSLTVRGQRALESSGTENTVSFFDTTPCGPNETALPCDYTLAYDLVGQIRSSRYIPGVSATPKWTGNIIAAYSMGELSTSLSARYIGGAKQDKTWCDNVDCPNFQNELGQYLVGSIDDNFVESYLNFSLNGSYNLRVGNMKQFQVYGSINNLFDKDPPYSGGFISGANSQYHDTMGRAYRMGVRMRF